MKSLSAADCRRFRRAGTGHEQERPAVRPHQRRRDCADQRARHRRHGCAGARQPDRRAERRGHCRNRRRSAGHPAAGCGGDGLVRPQRDPRPGHAARASLLPDGTWGLRPARGELHAPLSGRWRHHHAHRRQHERLHGHQPEARDRGRTEARTGHRCNGTLRQRTESVSTDDARAGRRAGSPSRRLLGRSRAQHRSRRTCRSRAPHSAPPSKKRTSAA